MATIDIKLKTYDELSFEITTLNTKLFLKDKEIKRLNNIIDDKKERQDIAIRLLQKMFGTDDYEINYIIGIINGQRQIKFDEELKGGE